MLLTHTVSYLLSPGVTDHLEAILVSNIASFVRNAALLHRFGTQRLVQVLNCAVTVRKQQINDI